MRNKKINELINRRWGSGSLENDIELLIFYRFRKNIRENQANLLAEYKFSELGVVYFVDGEKIGYCKWNGVPDETIDYFIKRCKEK